MRHTADKTFHLHLGISISLLPLGILQFIADALLASLHDRSGNIKSIISEV